MAQSHQEGNSSVKANSFTDLLSAPLSPNWTIDGLAEQLLSIVAVQPEKEFVLNALEMTDRQTQRLIRPLLACLATMSAAESGTSDNIYGGDLSFRRNGPEGPVQITGQFNNTHANVRLTLKRSETQTHSSKPSQSEPSEPYKPLDTTQVGLPKSGS
jgi:hypothetical protein